MTKLRKMTAELLVLVFSLLCTVFTANGCYQSGWSEWINDRIASSSPLPGEETVTDKIIPGGDKENMKATAKEKFCASGHGVITDIECVTVANETVFNLAQTGNHALKCTKEDGLVCYNRFVDGHICLDYKIRFFCNCSSPFLTTNGLVKKHTTAAMLAVTTKATPARGTGGINAPAGHFTTEKNLANRQIKSLPAYFFLTIAAACLKRHA